MKIIEVEKAKNKSDLENQYRYTIETLANIFPISPFYYFFSTQFHKSSFGFFFFLLKNRSACFFIWKLLITATKVTKDIKYKIKVAKDKTKTPQTKIIPRIREHNTPVSHTPKSTILITIHTSQYVPILIT